MRTIKKIKPFIIDFFQRADIFLLGMALICSAYGVFAVYKATVGMAAGGALTNPTKFVVVQVFSIILGLAAFVIFTIIDVDILGSNWKILHLINMALLVALVIFGQDDGTGNKSWIRFAGIGIQPSELIKIFYIIVAAKQMTFLKEYRDLNSFWSLVQMAVHFLVVFGAIIVVSSDLGSCTIIMLIFIAMMFMAGVKIYWFGIGFAAVAAAVPLLWEHFLKDYQKKRLIAPYDPSVDPEGYGIRWQTEQSKLTLASGRLTGVDESHRMSVFTGKHTDFIFAAIGENLGMIGCIVVFILLTILIVHIVRMGLNSSRTFDMLVCMGIASAVMWQTFVNIGMCIGITPVIGITLPFFSYGGSSMVTMYIAMGIVSGIKYKLKPEHFTLSV